MKTTFPEPPRTKSEQKSFYAENGYVVVPGLLSPPQLKELETMVDAAMDGTIQPDRDPSLSDFVVQWEPRVKDDPTVARRDKIRILFHLGHTHSWFWKLETARSSWMSWRT